MFLEDGQEDAPSVINGERIPPVKNLVEQTANYYKLNYRDAGNKLYSIDESITQKSGELTIHPIADIWKTSKNLMGLCNSEIDED